MNNANIIAAAELIAEFDPALAQLWTSQPFNRSTIVAAFHASLLRSRFSGMADRIAVALRSAIDSTRIDCA